MNLADAEALLGELAASADALHVEVGTSGRPPRSYAYLKINSSSDVEDYAIISTPGVNWFELEVAGGFHTGRADDLATDEDVREYIENYFRAAIAYLGGDRSTGRSFLFRIPFVRIQTDDGTLKLHLSVRGDFKHVFGRASRASGA